jgi:Arc/MetJ-type ribon-helix-helix transcriptional regulator
MTTITIPISGEIEALIAHMLAQGLGANKADLVRRALKKMAEDQAVADVLEAQKQPRLKGKLRDIAKKL